MNNEQNVFVHKANEKILVKNEISLKTELELNLFVKF